MSQALREFFQAASGTAYDPILIGQRNHVYEKYLKLPVDC
jgi:hypothetical protein